MTVRKGTMVIFFSGTGNSEYVARRIADAIHDDCMNLFDRLKDNDVSQMNSSKPWVVVSPTYAWQLPRIVSKWLARAVLTGNRRIYFVLTCGSETGNAGSRLKELCKLRDMEYMGCAGVVMPENYIAMFSAPEKDEALMIIDRAEKVIDDISFKIGTGKRLVGQKVTPADILKSTVLNPVFYPLFVHAGRFSADDRCTGCGLCARQCVTKNIIIKDGRPVWGRKCTHCMSCICRCPEEAVEYGKKSKGQPRYTCPKV